MNLVDRVLLSGVPKVFEKYADGKLELNVFEAKLAILESTGCDVSRATIRESVGDRIDFNALNYLIQCIYTKEENKKRTDELYFLLDSRNRGFITQGNFEKVTSE